MVKTPWLNPMMQLYKKIQDLQKTLDLFDVILQSIDYGITVQDKKGKVFYANYSAARLSGYKSTVNFIDATGSKIFTKFKLMDGNGNALSRTMLPGRQVMLDKKPHEAILQFQNIIKNKDQWALIKATPVLNKNGNIDFIVNTFQDVTNQIMENRRREHFIAIGSHELKTPLAGIKVLNQLMHKNFKEKKYKNNEVIFEKIDHRVNKLTKIINDFIEVEKIRLGKLEFVPSVIDMNVLITETIDELKDVIDTHRIIKKGRIKKEIIGDQERIGEVLSNLIHNAYKYSPEMDKIIVHAKSNKQHIIIGVEDFGIGIPKEYIRNIFDPFFRVRDSHTNKIKGLGLGLYIARKFIELHGGKMWVRSNEGKGTTFYFSLPYQPVKVKQTYEF